MIFPMVATLAGAALTGYGFFINKNETKRAKSQASAIAEDQRKEVKKKKADLYAAQYLALALGVQTKKAKRQDL